MKSAIVGALLAAALCLCGCRPSAELENQAFALVFAVDAAEGGGVALTARIPGVSPAPDRGGVSGKGGDSAYFTVSAAGDDYAAALDRLQWAVGRELNLSQIKLFVVSEDLARQEGFAELIDAIAREPHLYSHASFVVCQGRAGTFADRLDAVLGGRLSVELTATLDRHIAHGDIPDARLADAWYAFYSVYSDPVAIRGFLSAAPEDAGPEDADAPSDAVAAPGDCRFLGSALFRDGRLAGWLDGEQTRLLGLITGQVRDLNADVNGRACELTLAGPIGIDLDLGGEDMTIGLAVSLSAHESLDAGEISALEERLKAGILSLASTCQRLGVEPLGMAAHAARRFATLEDWQAFDFRRRFIHADIRVNVAIHGLN